MKVGIIDESSQKAYLYDNNTGKIIPWDGITEITEDTIELSEDEYEEMVGVMSEPFLGTIERALPFDKLVDEVKSESKPKPNPVYVPKHISRRKKGRK